VSLVLYWYSVSWKVAPDDVSSAQFPKWGAVSHSEWFCFANTVLVLLCCVISLAGVVVSRISFLRETEEQLTTLIAQRHAAIEPARLPFKFLALYVVVAVSLFCVSIGLIVLLVTLVSLVFVGSGAMYRALGIFFPIVSVAISFACGLFAIPVASYVKKLEWSIQSTTLNLVALSWFVCITVIGLDIWMWEAWFVSLFAWLLLMGVFVLCCFIMWAGAFARLWMSPSTKSAMSSSNNLHPSNV
jgi:hypothetical protein